MLAILVRKPVVKVLLAVCLVLTIALSFFFTREAAAGPAAQSSPADCASCHPGVAEVWHAGAHSSARTNHVLEESMNCVTCHPALVGGQGVQPPAGFATTADGTMQDSNCVLCHTTGYNPETRQSASYGVTCEACHTIVPDHPNKDIPTNNTTELCGKCHSDTRFNWDNWQNSRHYRENMSCAECHDPHSTELITVGSDPAADKSTLCISCHETDEHMSQQSAHGRANVSCVECHLGEKKGVDVFHAVPNHSFEPEIETCNKCHATTIHRPAMPDESVPAAVIPLPSPTPYNVIEQPGEAPAAESAPRDDSMWLLGLAGVIGLMGLIVGIMIPLMLPMLKNLTKAR